MSARLVCEVLEHSRAPAAAKLVLAAMAKPARDRECWMTVSSLAEAAGISRRSVQNQLDRLVVIGELEVVQPGGGRAKPTVYRICDLVGAREKTTMPSVRQAAGARRGSVDSGPSATPEHEGQTPSQRAEKVQHLHRSEAEKGCNICTVSSAERVQQSTRACREAVRRNVNSTPP